MNTGYDVEIKTDDGLSVVINAIGALNVSVLPLRPKSAPKFDTAPSRRGTESWIGCPELTDLRILGSDDMWHVFHWDHVVSIRIL